MKTETKFTKGEWQPCEHSWSDTSVYAGNKTVCTMSIESEATEETQNELETEMNANAKLIAAAPDMYNALVHIEQYVRRELAVCHPDVPQNQVDYILKDVRKAIQKVTD